MQLFFRLDQVQENKRQYFRINKKTSENTTIFFIAEEIHEMFFNAVGEIKQIILQGNFYCECLVIATGNCVTI